MLKCFVGCALIVLMAVAVLGQVNQTPPSYCCGPTYDFCAALAHDHTVTAFTYGRPSRPDWRGLVPSDCNNTGHAFFGNTLIVRYWSQQEIFWFDWPSDPNAAAKAAVWGSNPNEPLTVEYCTGCKMIISATSPNT